MYHSLNERNKEEQVKIFFFPVTSLYISKTEDWAPRQEDLEGGGQGWWSQTKELNLVYKTVQNWCGDLGDKCSFDKNDDIREACIGLVNLRTLCPELSLHNFEKLSKIGNGQNYSNY